MFHRWGRRPAYAWNTEYQSEEGWDVAEHMKERLREHLHGHFGHHDEGDFREQMRHLMHHMSRRFPFGPGRPGPGGDMPFFGRGDLKYGLLELLLERPKHGYEMIKELEAKASGFYTPSAGAVYPALQLMEDRDWITSQTLEGKKVYTITDAGRKALEEHNQNAEAFGGPQGWGRERHGRHGGPFGGQFGPFGHESRPELDALRRETMEVGRLLWAAVMSAGGSTEKLSKLRQIVEETHRQLNDFLSADAGEDEKKKNTL